MNAQVIGILGILILLVLIFSRMWIGLAMAFVGFVGFIILGGFTPALKLLTTVPYNTLSDYNMSTIPLFILMGIIIAKMGIGADLYSTAQTWIGQFRGGLALATTIACALFAAMASSSLPAILTLGHIAVPEMKKYDYSLPLACASLSCAGTLGILIPPSTGFILYSILTQQSIGKLFMAGILPGILLTILLCITLMIITAIHPTSAPAGPKTTFKKKLVSLKGTWPVLCLFILVIGGMYGGIFTATEGGAVGAFGAFVISAITRKLSRKNFFDSLSDAAKTTGMVFTLMMGGYILTKFIAITNLPFELAEYIKSLELSRYFIFAIIVLIYLILGMFLDIFGAIVLTVPIIFPVITALEFDPIWYGVVMVLTIEMGLVTPPFGLNIFTLAGITDVNPKDMFKYVWPFVAAMIVCIVILTLFPEIALFLVGSM